MPRLEAYRGTSFIRNRPRLRPCSRTTSRVPWWSLGGGAVSCEPGTPAWHIRQPRPDSGLGVQVKFLKPLSSCHLFARRRYMDGQQKCRVDARLRLLGVHPSVCQPSVRGGGWKRSDFEDPGCKVSVRRLKALGLANWDSNKVRRSVLVECVRERASGHCHPACLTGVPRS